MVHLKASSDSMHQKLLKEILEQVKILHAQRQTPVIYTSREELTFADATTRLVDVMAGLRQARFR